ncbi:hypothetical protein [Schumannella luteola]
MGRDWHPILQAREYQPGRWVMEDTMGRPFALIDFVKRGPERGYRVRAWRRQEVGPVIGYYTTLAGAAKNAHQRWISRSVPSGAPYAGITWPTQPDPWG